MDKFSRIKKSLFIPCFIIAFLIFETGCGVNRKDAPFNVAFLPKQPFTVQLPAPALIGKMSLEEAIQSRRSVRDYAESPLQLSELGQLLWAAQGITGSGGKRTAPSAGGLYPLEVYVVTWKVDRLAAGVYHYDPASHTLEQILNGSLKDEFKSAVGQGTSVEGAAAIVITGIYSQTTWRFREKGKQYVWMEAGHAAQNICLQAVSLKLGTVTMGSFNDTLVKRTLYLPAKNEVLYVMPVGKIK